MSSVSRAITALCFLFALTFTAHASALGNDALIFIGPSPLTVSYGDLEQQLRMAGAHDVQVTATWPSGTDLASTYRLVVVTPYGGTLDPRVGNALSAFASVGGGVVVMAEHDFGTEAGDALAMQLGIGARFAPMATSGGCGSTPAAATTHALMNGVHALDFAWSRNVSGGTLLAGTTTPIVTTEGTVVLAGDSDIFSDPVAFGGCPHGVDNQRFFRNLFTALPDPTHGMMSGGDAGMSGPDGGTTTTDLGYSCVASTGCASGICLEDQGEHYCTVQCTSSCASGYSCTDVGGQSVCVAPRIGGGCSASHARGNAITWLVIGLLALLVRRRQPA